MSFRLSDCLEHVLPQTRVDLLTLRHRKRVAHRPDTQSALIEEVFVVPNGSEDVAHLSLMPAIPPRPAPQVLLPFVRNFGDHVDPSPDVFAALGIVGGSGKQ